MGIPVAGGGAAVRRTVGARRAASARSRRRSECDEARFPPQLAQHTEARRDIDCAADDLDRVARLGGRLDHAGRRGVADAGVHVVQRRRRAPAAGRRRAAGAVGARRCAHRRGGVAGSRGRRHSSGHRLWRTRRGRSVGGAGRARRRGGVRRRVRDRRRRASGGAWRRTAARSRCWRAVSTCRIRPGIRRCCTASNAPASVVERVPARRASRAAPLPGPQPVGGRVVGCHRGGGGGAAQRSGQHRGVGARRWAEWCARCRAR